MIGRSTAEPNSSRRRAKFKSNSVTCPVGETWMLPGVTSPCIQPAACERIERLGRLPGDPERFRHAKLLPVGQSGRQRRPFQPGHDHQPRRLEHRRGQDRHQVRVRDALPHQRLALQQADRLLVVLPARAEHFHRVGGRPIGRRPDRPCPEDVCKASQSGKLDQLPLPYPTVRLCHARNAHGSGRRSISARSGSFDPMREKSSNVTGLGIASVAQRGRG